MDILADGRKPNLFRTFSVRIGAEMACLSLKSTFLTASCGNFFDRNLTELARTNPRRELLPCFGDRVVNLGQSGLGTAHGHPHGCGDRCTRASNHRESCAVTWASATISDAGPNYCPYPSPRRKNHWQADHIYQRASRNLRRCSRITTMI